jgi:hypothetical protein
VHATKKSAIEKKGVKVLKNLLSYKMFLATKVLN